MKNSLKKTFSFVKRFRRRIEGGNKELFHAIDIIMNVNENSPLGEWDISHQWSYDYIEETREKFNQLIQGHAIGAIKTAEVTAWALDMPIDQAQEYVDEIKAEIAEEMITNEEQTTA